MLHQSTFDANPSRYLAFVDRYTENLINDYTDKDIRNGIPIHSFKLSDCSRIYSNENFLDGQTYDDYRVNNEENALNNVAIESEIYVGKDTPAFHSGGITIGLKPMNRYGCRTINTEVYPLITPEQFIFNDLSQQAVFTNDVKAGIRSGNTSFLHKGDGPLTDAMENTRGGLSRFQKTFQRDQPTFIEPSTEEFARY